MEIFGDFIEELPPSTEYLIVGFSPSSRSIKERWRNNGLSADFVADYLSTFFGNGNSASEAREYQDTISAAVNYIANELLENAMKFCDETWNSPTTIQLHLYEERIILLSCNGIDSDRALKLQKFIDTLLNSDPQELYLSQLEKTVTEESHTTSGLGYLTLINDYGVKIGWKFESFQPQSETIALTTMVELSFEMCQ